MKFAAWGVLAALMAAIGCGATVATAQTGGDPIAPYRAAAKAYRADDCATVRSTLANVLYPQNGVPDSVWSTGATLLVRCELDLDNTDTAYASVMKATAQPAAGNELWLLRLVMEVVDPKPTEAQTTLEAIVSNRIDALATVKPDVIFEMGRQISDLKDSGLRLRYLKSVTTANFQLDDPFWRVDYFRGELAGLLADAGQADEARKLVGEIIDPGALAEASLDNRLRSMATAADDMRGVVERKLEIDRRLSAENPDRLRGHYLIAQGLRRLGRDQEALTALNGALNKAGVMKTFSDSEDYLSWYWNERAYVYASLGAQEDAILSMRRGIVAQEGGEPNVSQVINLAHLLNDFHRGAEALDELKVFDTTERNASPYGYMEMRLARVCAQAILGELSSARDDVKYAKEHESDNAGGAMYLLLCAGENDAAAEAFIRRMNNPDERTSLLTEVSSYERLGSKRDDFVGSHLAKIMSRADVKAAIERAGGARKFNIRRDDF